MYCGAERAKGRPYCSLHCAIAYKPKEAPRNDRVQFGSRFVVRSRSRLTSS